MQSRAIPRADLVFGDERVDQHIEYAGHDPHAGIGALSLEKPKKKKKKKPTQPDLFTTQ